MITKFIQNLIELFSEEPLFTGAFIDEVDARDILVTSLPGAIEVGSEDYMTDITFLPVANQKKIGSCVGHAEGLVVAYFNHLNSENSDVSFRYPYGLAKKIDGITDSQGTYPRVVSSVLRHKGIPRAEYVPNDADLSYDEYVNFSITEDGTKNAYANRINGYARVPIVDALIKSALKKYKLVTITIPVDPNAGWRSKTGLLQAPNTVNIKSYHRIVIYGFTTVNASTLYYFRNSYGKTWGKNGNGTFLARDYLPYLQDARVYTDIPADILKEAVETKYVFTKTLRMGSYGSEVRHLQETLGIAVDGSFGRDTMEAVVTLQKLNGLEADGIVGKSTRSVMNGIMMDYKATVVDFAEAIKQHEGWYKGSRSYRNNNPGNIRYVSQEGTTGQDPQGFAIFKTYEDGFNALVALIKRAKAGDSRIYRPNMSFLEFFSTYAPSFDHNNPENYARFVAQKLKVSVDYKIGDLV